MRKTTYKFDIRMFDLFEVQYLDNNTEQKEIFSTYLPIVKEFVEKFSDKTKILTITFYVHIMIEQPNSNYAISSYKKFAEHTFSVEEFLLISEKWIENARNKANNEIDNYMSEHYGALEYAN